MVFRSSRRWPLEAYPDCLWRDLSSGCNSGIESRELYHFHDCDLSAMDDLRILPCRGIWRTCFLAMQRANRILESLSHIYVSIANSQTFLDRSCMPYLRRLGEPLCWLGNISYPALDGLLCFSRESCFADRYNVPCSSPCIPYAVWQYVPC